MNLNDLHRRLLQDVLAIADIARLRRWAQAWSDDINQRIYQMGAGEDDLA